MLHHRYAMTTHVPYPTAWLLPPLPLAPIPCRGGALVHWHHERARGASGYGRRVRRDKRLLAQDRGESGSAQAATAREDHARDRRSVVHHQEEPCEFELGENQIGTA